MIMERLKHFDTIVDLTWAMRLHQIVSFYHRLIIEILDQPSDFAYLTYFSYYFCISLGCVGGQNAQ